MKKATILMAAGVVLLASCDTGTKDSYQTIPYRECNLIIDTQDASAPAQATMCDYELKYNISKNCMDVKSSDIILNNQKYSFETDTMAVRQKFFTVDGQTTYYLTFGRKGQAGVGSAASDLTGTLVACYIPNTSDVLNPSFTVTATQRLDLNYVLNDRYKVQTFWQTAYYVGQSMATSSASTYSTKESGYIAQFNFEKNLADIYVYNAEFSPEKEDALPKVMKFEGIPVTFTHSGFTVEAAAPKTTVLGKKDGRDALVDSIGYAATDFSLQMTSADLTDIMISYKLRDHQVNFRGSSIVK